MLNVVFDFKMKRPWHCVFIKWNLTKVPLEQSVVSNIILMILLICVDSFHSFYISWNLLHFYSIFILCGPFFKDKIHISYAYFRLYLTNTHTQMILKKVRRKQFFFSYLHLPVDLNNGLWFTSVQKKWIFYGKIGSKCNNIIQIMYCVCDTL